ncbi:kelch repeat-containing protein [Sorangium sp. So ce1099]|uniref:kelch repeat-containing protein n=1 Tax=Sorangium sp. So ce1099 TaxID=3133331 RepID=UPI003F5DCB30
MRPRCCFLARDLLRFTRPLLALAALALLSGCSAEPEHAASAALVRQFPDHAATVLAAREAFVAEEKGFRLSVAEDGSASRLGVVLPRHGSEPIRLRTPAGIEVRVVELGATGEGRMAERAVSYRRAGGTSFWTATDAGVEEWLLLDEGVARGDEPVAAWQVEGAALRARGAAVELVAEGSGAAVLRVTAPWAYAASGRPVAISLRARGARIELWVDAAGEAVLVDPAWRLSGVMNVARTFHTATLLKNGKVLVVGGGGADPFTAKDSVELYDPETDEWTSTTSMLLHRARSRHTATLLKDGKVLVAGGIGSGGPTDSLASAELYDPETNAWTETQETMRSKRFMHTATLLESGKVLVAGGRNDAVGRDGDLASAELYDPETDDWISTSKDMTDRRVMHSATLLKDGKVLVAGGYSGSTLVGAELYDPEKDAWGHAGEMKNPHDSHIATLLESGEVLVTGGGDAWGVTANAELYDPEKGEWTFTQMPGERIGHAAELLPGGKVLVLGGTSQTAPLASADLYDPEGDEWTGMPPMAHARDGLTATRLLGGEILVAGGQSESLLLVAATERYGLALGEACGSSPGSGCLAGDFCVDGVCCDRPCPCGSCAGGHCSESASPAKVGATCEPPRCDGQTRSTGPARCMSTSVTCPAPEGVDCAAYRCDQASGSCKSECSSLDDCAPRFVCNLLGHCVEPPPAPRAAGGCSAAPGRHAPSATYAAGVALVALAAARRRRRSAAIALVALAAALVGAPVALAQPAAAAPAAPPAATPAPATAAPAPPAPPASPAAPPDAAPPDAADPPPAENPVAEARVHFERGLDLYRQGAWEAALAEFLASRQVYPTWGATSSAALCLQQLRRYDEALALFETLLSDFSQKLPPDTRSAAQQAVVRLRGLVGTVDIAGAEIGASVMVDGQRRGDYPLPAPLRVGAGSHAIRVYKEGFEPFETRVDVAGGQVVRILSRLQKLVESGRLRITEQQGKALDVLVDGYTVGKTPWEGALPPGQHSVVLRGPGDLGTMPASVIVRLKQTTPLALRAEELTSTLRIEPSPVCASITVDGVTLGSGVWEGRLSSGPHRVEVAAGGFIAARREVLLARGARVVLPVALERVQLGGPPGRFLVELTVAPAFVPSLGGVAAGPCGGACSSGIGAGALGVFHAGYELWSGFGFGVMTGYLQVHQTVTARRTSLEIQDPLPESTGTVDDALALSGLLAGGWAGLSLGERTRLSMRLGAGALLGAVRDERSGTFTSSSKFEFRVDPTAAQDAASFFVVTPEVRAGLRFGEHLELTAGVAAAVLVRLKEPMWTNPSQGVYGRIDKDRGYFGRFEEEPLAGEVLIAIAPGIGARYTF